MDALDNSWVAARDFVGRVSVATTALIPAASLLSNSRAWLARQALSIGAGAEERIGDDGRARPFARYEPAPLSDDAFGHRDYTEALVSIVTDSAPPPTVGLFGPWGVGKSTIIGGVQDRLAGGATAFTYFDAWRYEGDSLRRQFLIQTATQLEKDGRLKCTYKAEDKLKELHVDTQEIDESLGFSKARMKKAIIVGAGFAVVGFALTYFGVFDAVLSGNFGSQVLASFVAFVVGSFTALLSQTVVVTPTTTTLRVLQDPDRFAEKFAELLDHLKPARLVIAIDNLDRCSPEKAVEMLSTIKTYLEPTVGGSSRPRSSATQTVDKEVVFVVSVDDQALRRHLVAQETVRSKDLDGFEIRRYVDEYLAKFFSARLPIRSILPDDMRGYIADRLKPLISTRDLSPEDAQELISIVDSGLRRNPRTVKQFRNDLESRLRLLEERENKADGQVAGIDPPVSGEVGMVAKLALIESEWPDAFERLQSDPRLLDEWEAAAESSDEVDWTQNGAPADPGAGETSDRDKQHGLRARRGFANFLRQARSIQSSHLRAMLSLKQSQKEVGLPGYSEFRVALVSSDRAQLEAIFAEDSGRDRARLAERMPDILKEEIESGYLTNARAVVDAVVSVNALARYEDARREILTDAARAPRMRPQLGLLDPAAVLANAELVAKIHRRHLIQPFVDRLADDALGDEPRRSVADALAGVAGDLTALQSTKIREALGGELLPEFGVYRKLAEVMPALLPVGAADAAMKAVAEPVQVGSVPEESQPSLSARPDAFAIAKLALPREKDVGTQRLAIEHVTATLQAHAEIEEFADDLDLAEVLLEPLHEVEPDYWSTLLDHLASNWHSHPRDQQARLIGFVGKFLDRGTPESQQAVPNRIAELLFEDSERGVGVSSALDQPPEPFRAPLTEQLVRVSSDPAHSEAAAAALLRIAGDHGAERLADVVVQLVAVNQQDQAAQLIDKYNALLKPHLTAIADRAAPELTERIHANEPLQGELLIALTGAMSETALDNFTRAMVDQLQGGAGVLALEALDHLRDGGHQRLRDHFAPIALDALTALPEIGPPNNSLLAGVCRSVERLDSDQQSRLATQLEIWLRIQPGQRQLLAGNIRNIEGLTPGPAVQLVGGLIAAERAAVDEQSTRQELLSAALMIRGRANSRATAALRKRLRELEAGNDNDKELAKIVSDTLG